MSIGLILVIILIIVLLGGVSGRYRGYGYGHHRCFPARTDRQDDVCGRRPEDACLLRNEGRQEDQNEHDEHDHAHRPADEALVGAGVLGVIHGGMTARRFHSHESSLGIEVVCQGALVSQRP